MKERREREIDKGQKKIQQTQLIYKMTEENGCDTNPLNISIKKG